MGIMICPNCGGKVATSRSDCPHCNYVFKKKVCPDCNEEVLEDSKECPICGHYFVEVNTKINNEPIIENEIKTEIKEEQPIILDSNTLEEKVNNESIKNEVVEEKTEKKDSSSLCCSYCGSKDFLMIGKNYYLCALCRMKFYDLGQNNNNTYVYKEVKPTQQNVVNEQIKEEPVKSVTPIVSEDKNIIQDTKINNYKSESLVNGNKNSNIQNNNQMNDSINSEDKNVIDNEMEKNIEDNTTVKKNNSFIFNIIVLAVSALAILMLLIGCFTPVEDSEYGMALLYYTVGLSNRLDSNASSLLTVYIIMDTIIYFVMLISILALVAFYIKSIIKYLKYGIKMNLKQYIYFLIPVVLHLEMLQLYFGFNNSEAGTFLIFIGLILFVLSLSSDELFYRIKDNGLNKTTIFYMIKTVSLFILTIIVSVMMNDILDYYGSQYSLYNILQFDSIPNYMTYFAFILGVGLIITSIALLFNNKKFNFTKYIPLCIGNVLFIIAIILVNTLVDNYPIPASLHAIFYISFSFELIFIVAIAVSDFLYYKNQSIE